MDNKLYEIERRAGTIGYDLYKDDGYCEIIDLLCEANDYDKELTNEEIEYIEDELDRLEAVLFG